MFSIYICNCTQTKLQCEKRANESTHIEACEEHNAYRCTIFYPHYFSSMETVMSFSQQHKEINRGMCCFNQATLHKLFDRRLNASHAKRRNARVSEWRKSKKKCAVDGCRTGVYSSLYVFHFSFFIFIHFILYIFFRYAMLLACSLLFGLFVCCVLCLLLQNKKIILHMLIRFLTREPRRDPIQQRALYSYMMHIDYACI